MLDVISDLVRNIAIIILFAIFIEMLLPNNDMSRYLQLVMGLFILIAILTPVVSFLDKDDLLETSLWKFTGGKEEVQSILAQGEEIGEINKQQALEEYCSRIQKQIEALARLVPGVEDVQSIVTLRDNDILQFGSISEVRIWVSPRKDSDSKEEMSNVEARINIEKIEIGEIGKNRELPKTEKEQDRVNNIKNLDEISKKIVKTVSNFYGIGEQQIKIIWQM